MKKEFANIIVVISHEKVNRPFGYRIPEALLTQVRPGVRVNIPFGAGNTLRTGYVVEVMDRTDFPAERLKEIDSVIPGASEPSQRLIMLASWMKEQYGSTMIQALKTVLPARQKVGTKEQKKVELAALPKEAQELLERAEKRHQTAKARLLKALLREPVLAWERVTKELKITTQTLKGLEADGVIRLTSSVMYRNPVTEHGFYEKKTLSRAQQEIADSILDSFDRGDMRTGLIHGITGSGKTEVYLELIAGMIQRGKQAIVLIPEIALTYQTVQRFTGRFGSRVSVMNSTLSAGEKQDQCRRAQKGEIDVMIGPRSALFVPFPNLGMILIDEEHETSYKSETSPKYHARETAEELARLSGAMVVLGSATPSLEAYSRAESGQYRLFTFKRAADRWDAS